MLKRDCGASEALPHIWDINVTMTQSCEYKEFDAKVMAEAQATYLSKALQPGITGAKRAKKEEEAGLSIGSNHNLQYNMYHPGLVAMALMYSMDLKLKKVAFDAFQELPLSKGLLVLPLVVKVLKRVSRDLYQPDFDYVKFPKWHLSKPLDQGKQPQGIIIFCHHTSMCILLARLLIFYSIGFLNLFGGDSTGNLADCLKRWAQTCSIPVLFTLLALATGINITQANILIFAQLNFNKQEDTQVCSWIVRLGPTQECWV